MATICVAIRGRRNAIRPGGKDAGHLEEERREVTSRRGLNAQPWRTILPPVLLRDVWT